MILFLVIALIGQPTYPTKLDLAKTKKAFVDHCQLPELVPWVVTPGGVAASDVLLTLVDSAKAVKATYDMTLERQKGPTLYEARCLYNYAEAAFGPPMGVWLRKAVKRSLKSLKSCQRLFYKGLLFELKKERIGRSPDIHKLQFIVYQL